MTLSQLSALRTQLRDVNVEYSALRRENHSAGRFVRMETLKAERQALMALLAPANSRLNGTAPENARLPPGVASPTAPHRHPGADNGRAEIVG